MLDLKMLMETKVEIFVSRVKFKIDIRSIEIIYFVVLLKVD